jgi:site-specific recombinase XerD
MGRKRTKDKDLPPRVYRKHGALWFVDRSNKWHRLGDNLPEAMAAWAKLVERPTEATDMNALLNRYMLEVAPTKAPRSYKDNLNQVRSLRAFFGEMRPEDVEPHHVYQFLEIRGQKARVQANREKALLSHVYTKAMEWGLLRYNPCRGVKRLTEKPRGHYVEDEDLIGFLSIAPPLLVAYCLYKYCTGRRQGEILSTRLDQLKPDGIHYQAAKGGKKLIIEWDDDLRLAEKMAKALDRPVKGLYLFCNRKGQPYTGDGFRSIWQRWMNKAIQQRKVKERFTEHDIRAKSATDYDEQGLDAHALLAHARRTTSDIYIGRRKVKRVKPNSNPGLEACLIFRGETT